MSVVAIPLGLMLAVVAADSAGRPPIAIMPVAAEQVSVEAMPRLEQLDERLRRAGSSLKEVALLDEGRTTANLAAVREMGITCGLDDVPCLGKVAVLVEVERLIVPIVRIDGESTALRLLVVDREGRRAESTRTFSGALGLDEARALLREALAAAPTSPPSPAPTSPAPTSLPAAVASSSPSPSASPSASPSSPPASGDGWWATRVGVAAVGGAVAVGAGIGAVIVDASLATPEPWTAREPRLQLGQGLVALAVVGGVASVIGCALLFVE